MLRDKFCPISQDFHRRHMRTCTHFLKLIMEEELNARAVQAQELQMDIENPIVVEKKIQTEICSELKQLKMERFLAKKHRTLLYQNEDDIRLLDVQIKRAHTQRQLIEQKALKAKMKEDEMQANVEENKRIAEECRRLAELTRQEERDEHRKKEMFRQDLLKQMKERQLIREQHREDIRKDREAMVLYTKKLKEDEEAEKKRIQMSKEQTKKDMEDYLYQHSTYKAQFKHDDKTDIQNYMEMIRLREENERMKKCKLKEERKKREALSEHIGEHIYRIQMEKQRRNEQLEELLIEERLAKDDEHYKQTMQQQLETQQNLNADLQNHRSFMEHQQELKRQRKLLILQEQLEMQKQQEQKDLQLKQLKLRKSKEYCQDLINAVQQQRLDREQDEKERQKLHQMHLDIAAKRRQEIEDEKLRLLRNEPTDIYKYIPKSAFSADHCRQLGLTKNLTIK